MLKTTKLFLTLILIYLTVPNISFTQEVFIEGGKYGLAVELVGFLRVYRIDDLGFLGAGKGSTFEVVMISDEEIQVQFIKVQDVSEALHVKIGQEVKNPITKFEGMFVDTIDPEDVDPNGSTYRILKQYIPDQYVYPVGARLTVGLLAIPSKLILYPDIDFAPGGALGGYFGPLWYLDKNLTFSAVGSAGSSFIDTSTPTNFYCAAGAMFDKYFIDFQGEDTVKERKEKLYKAMGEFDGNLDNRTQCKKKISASNCILHWVSNYGLKKKQKREKLNYFIIHVLRRIYQ